MSSHSSCTQCQDAAAHLTCGLCACEICKACAVIAPDAAMDLMDPPPVYLEHGVFCRPCFEAKVEPELQEYLEVRERAENVNVFYKTQSKESRFVRRLEKPLKIKDCEDRELAILKLAYLAAKAGFNTLVDVETSAAKVIHGKWQTSIWTATGVPATVDERQLERRFVGSPN